MRSSPRSAVFVLLFCGACSSDPDVVATVKQPDPPDFSGNLVSNCEEGTYRGSFDSVAAMSELPLELSGVIEFALTKSELEVEFLRFADAQLEGRNEAPDSPAARFSATVKTSECREGAYTTEITDGVFSFLDANDDPIGDSVAFGGTISGEYVFEHHTFYGEWHTKSATDLDIGGRWSAHLR